MPPNDPSTDRPPPRRATPAMNSLSRHTPPPPADTTPPSAPQAGAMIDTQSLGMAARRQAGLIARAAGAGAGLGLLVILGSVPVYSAMETILLDEERSELLNQVSALPNAVRSDATVQSEIEILRSQVLARDVVDRLHLDQDAGFMSPPRDAMSVIAGAIGSVAGLFTADPPLPPGAAVDPAEAARDAAAGLLRQRVFVERIGRSFVLQLGYADTDPARALAVARAYGDSYVEYQLKASSILAANAGDWIQDRLKVLSDQSLAATNAVHEFRARHNLVEFQGSLLTEQQQSELATELVVASAEVAQLRARLQSFEALMTAENPDVLAISALETLTPSDQTLTEMRSDYLTARRSWTAIVSERGEDHPQALRLQKEMTLLETSIREELERAMMAARAKYDIARSREASLSQDLSSFSERTTGDLKVVGQLAQLEAVADTYAAVYRDYLERYEITTQQQDFPIASVSIISRADLPTAPAAPRKKVLLALGLILGALVGLALAALREMGPARLRTPADVTNALGLPCAGLTPPLRGKLDALGRRTLIRTLSQLRADIDHRFPTPGGRILGVVSVIEQGELPPLPGLCETLAQGSDRVLVINAGGLSPGMAQRLNALHRVEVWKLSDLPATRSRTPGDGGVGDTADLRASFRTILLCLPPLTAAPFPDALARACDATLLSVPWGRVTPDFVRAALARHAAALRPVLTTVLPGADLRRARLYMRPGDYEEHLLHVPA